MNNTHFKTQYMPVYVGNSYKLASVRVYPVGCDSYEVENINPNTGKRFSNTEFLKNIEQAFLNEKGYSL